MSLGEAVRTGKQIEPPVRAIQQRGWSSSIALDHSPKSHCIHYNGTLARQLYAYPIRFENKGRRPE